MSLLDLAGSISLCATGALMVSIVIRDVREARRHARELRRKTTRTIPPNR